MACRSPFGCKCGEKMIVTSFEGDFTPTIASPAAFFPRSQIEHERSLDGGHCFHTSRKLGDHLVERAADVINLVALELTFPSLFARKATVRKALKASLSSLTMLREAVGFFNQLENLVPDEEVERQAEELRRIRVERKEKNAALDELDAANARVKELEAELRRARKPQPTKPARKSRRKVRPTPTAPTPAPMPKLIAERMAGSVSGHTNGVLNGNGKH